MRIVRYLSPCVDKPALGIADGDLIAELPISDSHIGTLLLLDNSALKRISSASTVTHNLENVSLLSPVARPGKILAMAANYHPHEENLDINTDVETPRVFIKPTTALLGPDDEIPYHSITGDLVEEIELGVVIGRPGKDIRVEDAFDHIFGYTIINDVSARSLRFSSERANDPATHWFDWLNGKWLDGHCPVGPWIVPSESMPDPANLLITTKINGEVTVQGNTSRMKFDIPRQIAYISRLCTLESGDLIATGVVPVATGQDEVMLKPGDLIEGFVEGIGTLRNTIIRAGDD